METKITLRFVGSLHNIIGKNKITLKLDGEKTLKEIIGILVDKFPETKRTIVDPELEDPRPNTLIIVNGREISVLKGLETIIKNGDEVIFVPVSHGG
ncbi:MAG: MoaD/ThiS family protein [Candidatus Bathyarchaeia archaeon]